MVEIMKAVNSIIEGQNQRRRMNERIARQELLECVHKRGDDDDDKEASVVLRLLGII